MDETTILNLLANPVTLAAVLSHILEQTDYFQDDTRPPTVKIAIMAAVCVVAAFILALFSPGGLPTTTAAWRAVGSVALLMLVSSQLFHLILEKGFPGLAELLTPRTTSQITVTANAAGATTATATTEQPSKDASDEPTLNAAAQAVNVATSDDVTAQAAMKFVSANNLAILPADTPHLPTLRAVAEAMQMGTIAVPDTTPPSPIRYPDAMQQAVGDAMAAEMQNQNTVKGVSNG